MRLDKFLVECGLGSRTEVKKLLKSGQIQVNQRKEKSAKYQVDEIRDEVCYQGQPLYYEEFVYYLLNKPKGVVSATEDRHHRTVLDLLDDTARRKGVFPVGRLDIDTHGLLLLTNNGRLAHEMLSPKKHVDKVYRVEIAGMMTQEDVEHFAQGITWEGVAYQPAHLRILSVDEEHQCSSVEVRIAEGKFHQVKRMVAACGKKVVDLQRCRMGPLHLDRNLSRGEYRRLTDSEQASLEIFGVPL